MKKTLKTRLRDTALGVRALRRERPDLVVYYSGGLGDNLLMSCVLREFARRPGPSPWLLCDVPALFANNPDVARILPNERWLRNYINASSTRLLRPSYASQVKGEDREDPPDEHLLARMCRLCGLTGETELRPYLYLSNEDNAAGARVPSQVAVQSSGLGAGWPIPLKEWFPDRFAAVVESLQGEANFVQLGAASDPVLPGALDLRGQTSLVETAAVLSQSRLFIGQVGFLMHVARAVDCPSVIVYGGREHPSQSGYVCNENLYTALECAPCWRRETCPFERECMTQISVADVVAAARRQLARARGELAVERVTL